MEFERVNKVCFEKDLDYLKKTFILQVIKEQMENEQEKFIENILPRIMHDWEISVIDRMDEDDPNIICTEIYEAEEKESLQEEEKNWLTLKSSVPLCISLPVILHQNKLKNPASTNIM